MIPLDEIVAEAENEVREGWKDALIRLADRILVAAEEGPHQLVEALHAYRDERYS